MMSRLPAMLLVGLGLAACGGKDKPAPPAPLAAEPATAWSALAFTAAGPNTPRWTDDIPARVVFDESRTSRVGAPLGGRVTAVLSELGAPVKLGAPLFTVTSADLADLRSQRAKAAVELRTAQTNLARVQALVDAKSLPAKELVAARQDMLEAQLAVKTVEQKLASLKVIGGGDASFTLTAPRDGVIVEKSVAVGQQVAPENGALIAIADLSDVWIVADLLEDAAAPVAVGTKAQVSLDGVDAPLEGKVEQVSAIVDPDRHTIPVRVKLANPGGVLRPNAYARIRFFDERVAPVSVPASAVISDGDTAYVYVRCPDRLVRRNVVASTPSGGSVVIYDRLTAGELVVSKGAALLDNQVPVEDDDASDGDRGSCTRKGPAK
jgi:RND family efflux transporter MFP subunit